MSQYRDKMKYITIYETLNLFELSIIRNLLEENEIAFIMPDDAINNSSGIAGLGINGMRIQVPELEKDKAIAILKERGFTL